MALLNDHRRVRRAGIVSGVALLLVPTLSGLSEDRSTQDGGGAASVPARPDLVKREAMKTLPDFFPILPWGPLHGWEKTGAEHRPGLESMAQCNFTMGGFAKAADLPLAEKLGLKVLIFPDVEKAGRWTREWKDLSDGEIDARVKALVEQGGKSNAILGYYIMDEPGASHFPALAKAVAAVRKHAPGKLAYINLFPGYATIGARDQSQLEAPSFTEYLERFVREVRPQVLSYDNYMVQYSMDLANAKTAARYYNDLIEVRRVAQEHHLPFWNIVSSNQIRPHTTIPSMANLAFQAYTTLAAGGRGVSWYTYFASGYAYAPIDQAGDKTLTWHYLRTINHQIRTLGPLMNRLESTGVFFTSPPPVKGLPVLPGRLVTEIETDVPMMVGEFTGDDGAEYCMPVNLSLERSAKFVLKAGNKPIEGQVVSAENGRLASLDNNRGPWVVAGQGMLVRVLKAGSSIERRRAP
jgi:hypothetical protein